MWCTLYIVMRNCSISSTFSPLYHPTGISAHACVVLFLQAWTPCIGTMNLRAAPFMSLTLPTDRAKLSALWVWFFRPSDCKRMRAEKSLHCACYFKNDDASRMNIVIRFMQTENM